MSCTISHIDTCLPDYLTDHHTRDGEALFGIPVDGATTWQSIKNQLTWEIEHSDYWGDLPFPSNADIATALADGFSGVNCNTLFDSSLGFNVENDYADSVMAWFLLSWDTDTDE